MNPLDVGTIRAQIDSIWGCGVQVFASLPSTNAWLSENGKALISPNLCVAETQTAGRGRRGKLWQSPQRGVTFSVLYEFDMTAAELAGLSLAAGCAVVAVLEKYTLVNLKLKWPNDVLCDTKKLCGLLIEINANQNGGTNTITGIGLNYSGVGEPANIDQPYTDLTQQLGDNLPPRDVLIGELANELLDVYAHYAQHGFKALHAQWEEHDAYIDQPIVLTQANGGCVNGVARGVAENGALQIDVDGKLLEYFSGEVSVRLQQ